MATTEIKMKDGDGVERVVGIRVEAKGEQALRMITSLNLAKQDVAEMVL